MIIRNFVGKKVTKLQMKRRISAFLSLFLLALAVMAEGRAKYVFYFIGDGMGVNQVNAVSL